MDKKAFAEKICRKVQEELGSGCKISLEKIYKNNGIVEEGLVILGEGYNAAPVIDLEIFWRAYLSGVPFRDVIGMAVAACREETPGKAVDLGYYKCFDQTKDRIYYRLIGREKNRGMLEKVPHIDFLDMAVCFYYACQGELGQWSIQVKNSHIEMWEVTADELMSVALQNTPQIMPYEYGDMKDVSVDMGFDIPDDIPKEFVMHVLTNKKKSWGAASMLYPGVLKEISGGKNLFILPSSVHETIIIYDCGQADPEYLKEMIFEVNRTEVLPEDVLSDSLYYYDAEADEIRLA